ncbi:LamG-like jellyroll fold domain-containing protein [Streptomyces sp. bgisy082]|uniref:LamG-like jellyroll fold domain-containing protein n=1 Tax=Streptomyces sp. bgisy082 TaxID=3413776 RepID=UPI003D73FABE
MDTPESLAVKQAKKTGKPVEVLALRTEFGEITARPDGTLESVTHIQPVRTRQNGEWVSIDPNLVAAPDGMVEPKAVLSGLSFSGGGDKPLVRMTRAGKVLELSWPKALPTPEIKGTSAVYPSVLPGVDLRMTATRTGFNQILVVKTKEAAANPELDTLRLGMATDGLSVRENADGSVEAVDSATGGTVFSAPKPMMYDSSATAKDGPGALPAQKSATARAAAAPGALSAPTAAGATHAAPVGVDIDTTPQGDGAEGELVLTPSQALLDSPDTVYPVHIDPSMDTPHASAWAGISRTYPSQPYYKFTYNSTYVPDFGTGYCASPGCSTADVKRVLYQVPVKGTKFTGKHILSAEFNVYESYSYSCTERPVDLYVTSEINKATTWANSSSSSFWAKRLQTVNAAKGWGGKCPAGYLEFGGTSGPVKDLVQRAATGGWPNITFGLRAQDESSAGTDAWKRFKDDASLRVTYNLPPHQPPMSQLTMSPGSICSTPTLKLNRLPQVTAKVSDPDGDRLGAQFAAAWDSGDGGGFKRRWWSTGAESKAPSSASFKASGSPFSLTLPATIPQNKIVGWEVRAWDGAEWGLWSSSGDKQTDCYFSVDTTRPSGPTVSSTEYPGSHEQQDLLPWTDGVGRYGTFVIDSASTDVVRYEYGLDTGPSASNTVATTAGAARSVSLLMNTAQPHYLSVRAIDGAGNASQNETYYFNVLPGHPQRAGWNMDDKPGTGTLVGSESRFDAVLGEGATPGAEGRSGSAVTLDGTAQGHLSTDRAVLETNRSFTMSAWVKPTVVDPKATAVLTQLGLHHSITLGLVGDKWSFKAPTTDSLPGNTWYSSTSATSAVLGKWTHLAGVYDATAKTLRVYVDGAPATAATGVTLWPARGAMTAGRMMWSDGFHDPLTGSIDDIAVWDRALSPAELTEAAAGRPVNTGLPAKAVWNLDDTGTTVVGRPEATAATLYGGVPGVPGVADKAVRFDGVDDYARTARPQVDGTRSFSVSTWVKIPAIAPTDHKPRMIATQNGVNQNEFSLYYSAANKKWKFGRYTEDTASAALVTTQQADCTGPVGGVPCFGVPNGEWTHLLGVSDSRAGKLRLFVNGYPVGETNYTQTKPWASPGGLQIGAVNRAGANAEFLNGEVDDLQVYDRVVTADEAKLLVRQRPQVGARWKFNEASGTPSRSPDESTPPEPVDLVNGAQISSEKAAVGTGALLLDGIDDYAATTRMPVYTGQSFSIAGWAQTAAAPTRDMTVLSIAGTKQSAVEVSWDHTGSVQDPITEEWQHTGRWKVSVTSEDGTVSTRTTAVHTFDYTMGAGSWNHLAVVYDGFADQLSLYVNGSLENQLCSDDDTSGTCVDHVSWATAPQPFVASGQVQLGRDLVNGAWGSYFSGQIDDMWMYQGVLSPAQIVSLAEGSVELDTTTGP